jgi:hypothetical protein
MEVTLTRKGIIRALREERRWFEGSVRRLSDEEIVRVSVQNTWTVKDIMAHITAWEVILLDWLDAAAAGNAPNIPRPGMWGLFIEDFNARVYAANRDRSLAAIRLDFADVYARLMDRLNALPDNSHDPAYAMWLDGTAPWQLLLTFATHYHDHRQPIDVWLADRARQTT